MSDTPGRYYLFVCNLESHSRIVQLRSKQLWNRSFEDMTLLLAPISIKNLKQVPLTDASANQASLEFIFKKMTSDLGMW